ncbi:NAD(P)-dependent oxidoreductase [Oryzicola mucosus]|uniref:Glyoxylate/hydroxypyruvate reductase A n=1 Tax=Oryzicola mucosus TaxID=2767425 RepID=A0A8J6PXU5_9HYPH|nr:NAD(P)-dependent oxidoreductase [Oryzicola mucosus]MBD0417376.1 glyoxylate/hydroxypyruvate reductase A [Oryzicola mucosus]
MAVLAHHIPEAYLAAIRREGNDLNITTSFEAGDPDICSALFWLDVPAGLSALPSLRLVLSLGAGVERLTKPGVIPAKAAIGRISNDIQSEGMADYVLLHVLRQHRQLARLQDEQRRRVWEWRLWPRARDVTVGVMGLGRLGSEAARKLSAMGFSVRGWSRSLKRIDGIETFAGTPELPAFLSACHHLVCLLPLTHETENILAAPLFSHLPRGAFLINAGRGAHLDEAALLAALDSGQLAGATLDVLRQEPPTPDHPFFEHPGILLTPHSAVCSTPEQIAPDVVENLRRAERGEPPLYAADRATGY